MHTEQKIWSNWSLRQQNYLTYPTLPVLLWGPCSAANMLNMPKSACDSGALYISHIELELSDACLIMSKDKLVMCYTDNFIGQYMQTVFFKEKGNKSSSSV